MASSKHAVLSPSSAHRWLHCTPSARFEARAPDTAGKAAAEGTAAHALAEFKLQRLLNLPATRPRSEYDGAEMEGGTDGYAEFVQEQRADVPDALMLVEQHLDLREYVPEAFGSADCLLIGGTVLHVIDFKYGLGVLVSSECNPQMMLYALGALLMFGAIYDITEVRMSIYQPRRENVSTYVVTADELLAWAEQELRPKAQLAFAGEGEFQAGDWCQFCRMASTCRARAQHNLRLIRDGAPTPARLSDAEIATLLPELPGLIKWANDLSSYAFEAAVQHGKSWPGYKLVAGRSIRKFSNEEVVAKAAHEAGYTDIYESKLLSPSKMEQRMGKQQFNEVLGKYVIKPQGKPTLVPEGDKRLALDNVNEFTEV